MDPQNDHPEITAAEPSEITAAEPSKAVRMRAGDDDRRRVAGILHDALGKGQLTVSEFDERTAQAWAAAYLDDLKPLTVDLQADASQAVELADPAAYGRVVTGERGSSLAVAVWSGTDRSGVWTIPAEQRAIAVMGGMDLDLRHANFGADTVHILAVAIMGGIEITVPDDVRVDVRGLGVMGAFTDDRKWRGRPPVLPDSAPRLIVSGLAFWGAVVVNRKPSGPRSDLEVED